MDLGSAVENRALLTETDYQLIVSFSRVKQTIRREC